jgi:hypothetical protein
MFDADRLRTTLELQRKSYELLRWTNQALKAGRLRLLRSHEGTGPAEAARGWLARNLSSLPPGVRPGEGELEELAHLFASYLTTSFRVASTRRLSDGCGCPLCSRLVAGEHLQARTPTKLDRAVAERLKLSTLEALASQLELPLLPVDFGPGAGWTPARARDLALVTWAHELQRRGEFRGQGEPVLALWRQLAWKDDRPDKRRLSPSVEEVLQAEGRLGEWLKVLAARR